MNTLNHALIDWATEQIMLGQYKGKSKPYYQKVSLTGEDGEPVFDFLISLN